MSLITEAASYRGVVVEHAVGASSNGNPQLVVKLRALERFDFEEKIWVDWQTREDCEMTAYLVMFNAKGDPIFHVEDIIRVFEWDGASLVGLNELDLENAEVQFNVILDTYDGKTKLKVAGIKNYEDTPGTGAVKKMDADDLAQMNAKFGNALKALAGAPKAAKAPAKTTTKATKAPAAPKKTTAKTKAKATVPPPPPPAASEAEVEEAVNAAVAETQAEMQPPPPPPKAGATTEPATAELATMTYEEAWTICYSKKAKATTDEELATIFSAAMYRVAPDQDETSISGEDWVKISDAVVAECGVV